MEQNPDEGHEKDITAISPVYQDSEPVLSDDVLARDEDDEDFGEFVLTEHIPKSFHLPSLSSVLETGDQRMAFVALCYLVFDKLIHRYARYEFIDLTSNSKTAAKRRSNQGSASPSSSRLHPVDPNRLPQTFRQDDDLNPLIETDDREDDLWESDQIRPQSAQSISQLPLPSHRMREPFPEHSHNPETIEDIIYFNREMDGNLNLCYAMRTWREWSESIMSKFYEGLEITPQGTYID